MKKYSWVIVTYARDLIWLDLNFVQVSDLVARLGFLLSQGFLLFLLLFEGFYYVVGPWCGEFASFLFLYYLVDVGHLVGNVSFQFFLLGPLHFCLVCTRTWTEFVGIRFIFQKVTPFGFILSWLLSLLDLEILPLLNLLKWVLIYFLHMIAFDTTVDGLCDLSIHLTDT